MTRERATLIILAGGEAKRMGFPKHRLMVDGERVIGRLCRRLGRLFSETVVVGRELADVPAGVRPTEDRYLVRSPLVGIHAGLTACRTDLGFVVACDMPYVEPALVEFLLKQAVAVDVAVPVVRGHHEPLCAAYRKSCLPAIGVQIERGMLKVSTLYDRVTTRRLSEEALRRHDPTLRSFLNLNTHTEVDPAADDPSPLPGRSIETPR